MNILFVTWDGPNVTYLEGLFLPIFRKLGEEGFRFHVLQFTWAGETTVQRRRAACEEAGVSYQPVSVWRRPVALGSLVTAIKGGLDLRRAVRRHGIDVVMPRSTLPALTTLLSCCSGAVPIIFDADGLPLDERVEFAGQSPSGIVHRALRDVEAQITRVADVVLTRSRKANDILLARAGAGTVPEKFFVVSNGRDAAAFEAPDASRRVLERKRLRLDEHSPLVIFVGSMGAKYCLGEMLQFFDLVHRRRPSARFLILTSETGLVLDATKEFPELEGKVSTLSVPAQAVPGYLACSDLGLAMIQPSYSMQGAAAIKVGEYLLCGCPVVATPGIGDGDWISSDTTFLVRRMDLAELTTAADWFVDRVLPNREAFSLSCRAKGLLHFSLEGSVSAYREALRCAARRVAAHAR